MFEGRSGAAGPNRTAIQVVRGELAGLLLLLLAALPGCAGSTSGQTRPSAVPTSWGHSKVFSDAGQAVEEQDMDGDGRVDHRVVSRVAGDPRTRTRVEWDLNHDGNMDVWQFFDDVGQLKQEELDLDWDGKLDVILYYEAGRLVRKESSTNFMGRMTVRKQYDAQGNLTVIEQDTDDDGKFDTWEFYEGGKLVRMGRDTNRDGKEDVFTEPSESYRKKAEEALKQATAKEERPAALGGDAAQPNGGAQGREGTAGSPEGQAPPPAAVPGGEAAPARPETQPAPASRPGQERAPH